MLRIFLLAAMYTAFSFNHTNAKTIVIESFLEMSILKMSTLSMAYFAETSTKLYVSMYQSIGRLKIITKSTITHSFRQTRQSCHFQHQR